MSSGPKNGRPVLVYTAPVLPSSTPNLSALSRSPAQTMITQREPMCFSSQMTVSTPALR